MGRKQDARDEIASWTTFNFEAERFGYGSGKPGSAVNFAIAVMYLYGVIVALYFVNVIVLTPLMRWDSVPTVVAWGDLQELILLIWNSKPQSEVMRHSG